MRHLVKALHVKRLAEIDMLETDGWLLDPLTLNTCGAPFFKANRRN